jgi:hypothetical protein
MLYVVVDCAVRIALEAEDVQLQRVWQGV